MSIYIARKCNSFEEWKEHKFHTLITFGQYEKYDNMDCFETEDLYYGRDVLTNIRGEDYPNWQISILKNLEDGTQIQLDLYDDNVSVRTEIEIFNEYGKLIFCSQINEVEDTLWGDTNYLHYRPTGLGTGTTYITDMSHNLIEVKKCNVSDILDWDSEFLDKLESLRQATYMPALRNNRESYDDYKKGN